MSSIKVYTWSNCPYCVLAKNLLADKGVDFLEINLDGKEKELNPDYGPAQARLHEIRPELLATYTAFPFLSAGHDPRSEANENVAFVDKLANAKNDEEITGVAQHKNS